GEEKAGRVRLGRGGALDRGHDDENAIGAERARLDHLVGVEQEILAQHGERGCRPRGGKVLRTALERGRVGKHRQARRAARLVRARERRRIEIPADQPLRRARLLDLGNERSFAAQAAALDRGQETARRRGTGGLLAQLGKRASALGGGDFLALIGFDPNKHVAHGQSLEIAIRRSSRPSASPESIDFFAIRIPPWRSDARPATTSAAAALRIATSRNGPFLPLSTSSRAAAFSLATPPRNASDRTLGKPKSSGERSNARTAPFSNEATRVGPAVVISSSPSEPCTTIARSDPRFLSTCAIGSTHCRENTPTICRLTRAGLDSGPSRLKMVRVPSSTRVGPTCFIAGWCAGANMKPIPASRMQREIASGERSMGTPSAARTSAAPQREDSARLPCFATGTPAPATMKAAQVEMLYDPDASPPVPTTSIASAGASTASIFARMVRTAPVI